MQKLALSRCSWLIFHFRLFNEESQSRFKDKTFCCLGRSGRSFGTDCLTVYLCASPSCSGDNAKRKNWVTRAACHTKQRRSSFLSNLRSNAVDDVIFFLFADSAMCSGIVRDQKKPKDCPETTHTTCKSKVVFFTFKVCQIRQLVFSPLKFVICARVSPLLTTDVEDRRPA